MHIISVSPFSKSIKTDSLSYFHNKKIAPGNIVTIPLRNKSVKGLVIDCVDAKTKKQELREAKYEMKKVRGVSKNPLFTQNFIQTASETAEFFATSPGSVINSLVPKAILNDFNKFQFKEPATKKEASQNKETGKYIIQTQDEERYSDYKSLIRSQFAKNKSVFFCVPTIEDALFAQSRLTKGIEKSTFVFHSKITKKQLCENWTACLMEKKPVLIIATGSFLSIPRNDIGSIIVERENSIAYKTYARPYFDIRRFAENLAKNIGASFVLGDLLLRAETLWRFDQHEFVEQTPIKFRSLNTASGKMIDMKLEKAKTSGKKIIQPILAEQITDLIKKASKNNDRTLILCSRKGLSPIIICNDCGKIVECENCSSPVVLYGKKVNSQDPTEQSNYFRCHHCGEMRSAGERCRKCDSWNLTKLGFGVDTVTEKVKEVLPESQVFVLDKEKASTHKKARDVIEKFMNHPAGVLIGTEMTLLYLKEPVENVIVSSIDSMFSLPDFQIRERVLNILLRARAKALNNFIIQTRDIKNEIFKEALSGNLADFYRQEFIKRKNFNYPPFSILIKITGTAGTKQKIQKDFEGLKQFLMPQELNYYSGLTVKVKNQFVMHGILKLERDQWPNKILVEKIRNIPPQFRVEIDAQSVV
jgi:primosomal protein N' (replication factor Y)